MLDGPHILPEMVQKAWRWPDKSRVRTYAVAHDPRSSCCMISSSTIASFTWMGDTWASVERMLPFQSEVHDFPGSP